MTSRTLPSTPDPLPEDILKASYVADWIEIEEKTLAQWRWRRVGPPYIKVGHQVRYRRSDVQAWLDANTVSTTAAR